METANHSDFKLKKAIFPPNIQLRSVERMALDVWGVERSKVSFSFTEKPDRTGADYLEPFKERLKLPGTSGSHVKSCTSCRWTVLANIEQIGNGIYTLRLIVKVTERHSVNPNEPDNT